MPEPWRIGNHYSIHVYSGDDPIATFHDKADAIEAVLAVNAARAAGVADPPAEPLLAPCVDTCGPDEHVPDCPVWAAELLMGGSATQGAAGDHEFKRFDHAAAGPGCVAVVGSHGRLCARPETDPIHSRRATQGAAPTPAPSMFIGGKPVNPNETVHLVPVERSGWEDADVAAPKFGEVGWLKAVQEGRVQAKRRGDG